MSMKVLVIDPDWRFAKQAAKHLESLAHHVVTETHRTAALGRLAHWRPDLVIAAAEVLDTPLIDTLHGLEPRPAVLLTGWMDRTALAWRVWQSCGDELLMKPVFRAAELHAAIVSALENAAAGTRPGTQRLVASA